MIDRKAVPNLLINNYCNLQCEFCFAKNNNKNKKEISINNFKKYLEILQLNKINKLKLLGGEPTIHSNFEKIVKIALENNFYIEIFTNLVKNNAFLKNEVFLKNRKRIFLSINISTNYFEKSTIFKINNLKKILNLYRVSFAITLSKNKKIYYKKLLTIVPLVSTYRVGIENPTKYIDKKGNISFRKIGNELIDLIKNIFNKNKDAKILLNCGITRCMFNKSQINFLSKKNIFLPGWGCNGKYSSFDVNYNLTYSQCYISKNTFSQKLNTIDACLKNIKKQQIKNKLQFAYDKCKICKYFGFENNLCNGPCFGNLTLKTKT